MCWRTFANIPARSMAKQLPGTCSRRRRIFTAFGSLEGMPHATASTTRCRARSHQPMGHRCFPRARGCFEWAGVATGSSPSTRSRGDGSRAGRPRCHPDRRLSRWLRLRARLPATVFAGRVSTARAPRARDSKRASPRLPKASRELVPSRGPSSSGSRQLNGQCVHPIATSIFAKAWERWVSAAALPQSAVSDISKVERDARLASSTALTR